MIRSTLTTSVYDLGTPQLRGQFWTRTEIYHATPQTLAAHLFQYSWCYSNAAQLSDNQVTLTEYGSFVLRGNCSRIQNKVVVTSSDQNLTGQVRTSTFGEVASF